MMGQYGNISLLGRLICWKGKIEELNRNLISINNKQGHGACGRAAAAVLAQV